MRQVPAFSLAFVFAMAAFAPTSSAASVEKVLYAFQGGTDGASPSAGLIADSAGNLYTTTEYGGSSACADGCGTIVRLSPPAPGQTNWTEKVLYSFQGGADGKYPVADLIADRAGNLYTTTFEGGGGNRNLSGTIVRLSPGATSWTETVLYAFNKARLSGGVAGLLADAAGDLYTTADGGPGPNFAGGVVKLSPPAKHKTSWTEQTIHAFSATGSTDGATPRGGLLADAAGNLYTTTSQGGPHGRGAIVRLSPPAKGQTSWTETVLYLFQGGADGENPYASLIADAAGNLYTTTAYGGGSGCVGYGCGTIVRLSPPAKGQTSWTETVLYSFQNGADGAYAFAGLIMDAAGNLYTTTNAGGANHAGTIVRLSPPAQGQTSWTETVLYSFQGGADGAGPEAGLIADSAGNLYTTTNAGGGTGCVLNGCGTIVELSNTGFVVP